MSKTVPSGVQTGYSNGCRDKLGKKKYTFFLAKSAGNHDRSELHFADSLAH